MPIWKAILLLPVIICVGFSAYMLYKKLTANPFTSRSSSDIQELSDQELLLTLDRLTIKIHSLKLSQLDAALQKRGEKFCPLYWCDLIRLYVFSCETEVFLSFLSGLSFAHWEAIAQSFRALGLHFSAAIAEELCACDELNLEQSEHFRYSIRDVNPVLQTSMCQYIRKYIDCFA